LQIMIAAVTFVGVETECPFLKGLPVSLPNPHTQHRELKSHPQPLRSRTLNISDVQHEIAQTLQHTSADDGNYGPLMIRLAWQCAGTYGTKEGRGGCDGARIRFKPEVYWPENAGLTQALSVLQPIKDKHGEALSWGDLIVLAGSTAIEKMGGPHIKFCGGRVDAKDGSESWPEAPSAFVVGKLTSAKQIREAFKELSMHDREIVALIAGGHTFGRCHPWISGYNGSWTSTPNQWSNQYITNLLELTWSAMTNNTSIGMQQYGSGDLIMLESDMVLKHDNVFLQILREFRRNFTAFTEVFGLAWEKLMNSDLGAKACAVEEPWFPNVDYSKVREAITSILERDQRLTDLNHYGPLLVRFAWHCAGTFRITDYRGGCDGARIRFEPERSWNANRGLIQGDEPQDELAFSLLQPIKAKFGVNLSWADLIILAGTTALEQMGVRSMNFCPGRTDAADGSGSKYLNPRIYLDAELATAVQIKHSMSMMGFTAREITLLIGGGHSIGKAHHTKSGFEGTWTGNASVLSNSFFRVLLHNDWVAKRNIYTGRRQFTDSATHNLMMLNTDLELKRDSEFRAFAQLYANDNKQFLYDFPAAWEKLINSDRFGRDCATKTNEVHDASSTVGKISVSVSFALLIVTMIPGVRIRT